MDYKNNILPAKCNEFVEKLIQSGVDVANIKVQESPLGKYVTITTNIDSGKVGCKGILLAKGEVKQSSKFDPFSILLAIEFGAGKTYNPNPNPKADELGYGVGTFPGQIHAFDDNGWMYWDEEDETWKHTYGVKATMPMYNADVEIINNIRIIAKDVFK